MKLTKPGELRSVLEPPRVSGWLFNTVRLPIVVAVEQGAEAEEGGQPWDMT